MSEEHVKLVERGYEAWNSGDRGWVLEHMSEDVRWITPPDDPDPGTYPGVRGGRALLGPVARHEVFHFDDEAKCTEVHEYYDRDAALSAMRGVQSVKRS